jgi:CTP synthase
VDTLVLRRLNLEAKDRDLSKWNDLVHRVYNPKDVVRIGIVGKYVEYEDSYKSLKEALVHGALAHNLKLEVNWIEAEGLETADKIPKSYEAQLEGYDGLLVPGGFGKRGIEGMLKAIQYAREKHVPYFGICLGMQTACIEYARNVCGLADANSSEFDPATPHRVIYKLRELRGVEDLGGTMRLGAWPCKIEPGTLAYKVYGQTEISERHRHRYEFNREYEEPMVAAGCAFRARLRTVLMWRWSRYPAIRSSSDANFIRNSNRSRWSRIRCLRRSWALRTNTGRKRKCRKTRRRWRCFCGRRKWDGDKPLRH